MIWTVSRVFYPSVKGRGGRTGGCDVMQGRARAGPTSQSCQCCLPIWMMFLVLVRLFPLFFPLWTSLVISVLMICDECLPAVLSSFAM